MNQKYTLWVVIAVIVIAGASFLAYSKSQENKVATEKSKMAAEEKMMAQDESKKMSPEEDKMKEDKMMEKDDSAMMKSGQYKDYSVETVKSEQAAGNKVVLFFHAPWCPDCKAADAAFKANLEAIPGGVTILKTDYDSNTELKKKYGVTYQHTFVQIDDNQNKITSWVSGDISMLIKNIK